MTATKASIVLHETNKDYVNHFRMYLRYCKDTKIQPLKPEAVTAFVRASRDGWPNDKPKSIGTMRARLNAIKAHFKLNEWEVEDLTKLSKELPSYFTVVEGS